MTLLSLHSPEKSPPIYFHSLWENGITTHMSRMILIFLLRRLPTAFSLGAVCQWWRQLARSTPQLWTTLSFTLVKPTKFSLLETIRNWLQLSGDLSLTICVAKYKGYFANYQRKETVLQEIYGPVLDALKQHSGRWQKLDLRISEFAPYSRHFCGSVPRTIVRHRYLRKLYLDVIPHQ